MIVRFKETFRERMPEWIQSAGMLLWGLITLSSVGLFTSIEFFYLLLLLMNQTYWGLFATLVGSLRLIFLIINGAWRPSAHIRAVGCVAGVLLWGSLLISSLSLQWLTPTSAIYAILLSFDLISLWFASGDAKLADLSAKGKI